MRRLWIVAVAAAVAAPAMAREVVVRDQAGYAAAVKALQPGDTVVLADGEWRDFAAVFTGEGRPGAPIRLRAEHPGKVVLTGRSSLAVAGKYLIVADLVFRDGFAPKDEVVSTRVGKRWADHVRLTGIVIDGFSNPDRRFEDHWVALYGQAIRVDHSHFQGKQNNGAMLVVVREGAVPLDNRVMIDHNYFGPRPVLGSNGGETIRIGTSKESMSDSHSVVEDNWFERCDGEVEIVSVKSGGNIVRRNVVVDSQGAIVLRHGNGNLVERNVFLGRGLPRTGGVRIINERQVVRGNYMEGLRGIDFTSAITVMNGVPNGPINRYLPVRDALIANNSLFDVTRVTLAAGADAERSQPPTGTRFERNLFVGPDPFRAEADTAGITWTGNVVTAQPKAAGVAVERREVAMTRAANGLLYPIDPALAAVGAPRDLQPIAREATGVAWYAKPGPVAAAFGTGATARVGDGAALVRAVAMAKGGDTIRLRAGAYRLTAPLVIAEPLTIAGEGEATLSFTAPTLFQLADGGSLRLAGLTISGADAPPSPGNAVIRAAARPMLVNYRVELDQCRVRDLKSPGFDVLATTPATLAEEVRIVRSGFTDVSGAVVAGHAELGRDGFYGTESVTIERSAFTRVGTVADLYRGGTDESTYGPRLTMTGSTVTDSGPVRLSGVQEATITGNSFTASKGVEVTHSVGYPHTVIADNSFTGTPAPVVRELSYRGPPRAVVAGNRGVR